MDDQLVLVQLNNRKTKRKHVNKLIIRPFVYIFRCKEIKGKFRSSEINTSFEKFKTLREKKVFLTVLEMNIYSKKLQYKKIQICQTSKFVLFYQSEHITLLTNHKTSLFVDNCTVFKVLLHLFISDPFIYNDIMYDILM